MRTNPDSAAAGPSRANSIGRVGASRHVDVVAKMAWNFAITRQIVRYPEGGTVHEYGSCHLDLQAKRGPRLSGIFNECELDSDLSFRAPPGAYRSLGGGLGGREELEALENYDLDTWLAQWMRDELPELGGKTPTEMLSTPGGLRAMEQVLGACAHISFATVLNFAQMKLKTSGYKPAGNQL